MIEVCFITDKNYLVATMTAIKSLVINNKNECIKVYVICSCVSSSDTVLLKKLSTKKIKIEIINVDKDFEYVKTEHKYVSKTALLKFYLPELIPNSDKILYLDDDILVLKSLKELCEINIDSYYAAVVKDMPATIKGYNKELNLVHYFNSGVMLLNLKKMREEKISEKLIEYKKSETDGRFMDQNAFNKIFNLQVRYMDLKYNYMQPNLLEYSDYEIAKFYNIKQTDILSKSVVVFHITGGIKPWKNILSKEFEIYLKYFLMLPSCKVKQETMKSLYIQNPARFIKYCMKQIPLFRDLVKLYENII